MTLAGRVEHHRARSQLAAAAADILTVASADHDRQVALVVGVPGDRLVRLVPRREQPQPGSGVIEDHDARVAVRRRGHVTTYVDIEAVFPLRRLRAYKTGRRGRPNLPA